MGRITRNRHLILGCGLPLLLATVLGIQIWLNRVPGPGAAVPPIVSGPALPPGRTAMQIALGFGSGCFLDPEGELWGWGMIPGMPPIGFSQNFQYGDAIPERLAPGSRWNRVSFGGQHVLLIREDRTLWGLGYNMFGELGAVAQGTPGITRLSSDTNWTEIAAGQFHSAGLQADGSLWTWGSMFGSVPQRARTTPLLFPPPTRVAGTNRWLAIAAGGENGAAVRHDGSLWFWKASSTVASLTLVANPGPWNSLDTGFGVLGAIDTHGRLGAASIPMPGISTRYFSAVVNQTLEPLAASAEARWDRVLCSANNLIARRTDGTWWGMGLNLMGELGLGDRRPRDTLTRLTWPPVVVAASLEQNASAFVLADGSLWRSGQNFVPMFQRHSSPARDVQQLLSEIGVELGVPGSHSSRHGLIKLHPTKFWTWPGPATAASSSPADEGRAEVLPETTAPTPPSRSP